MKSVFAFCLALAFSAFGLACVAQNSVCAPKYGAWTSTGPWGGGYVQNVVLCPSDPKRCYAYIDIGGVSRSDDGGNTWRSMDRTLPISCYQVRGLRVDPRNADELLIAAGSYPHKWEELAGIYRSSDGGETFTLVQRIDGFGGNEPFRPAGFILCGDPANPDVILAASAMDGVWRSSDNGRTWRCLGMKGVYATDLRFDLENPKRLWLCSPKWSFARAKPSDYETGFFRSEDGGGSWTKLSGDSPSEILQDPSDPKRVFGIFDESVLKLSEDGGATWRDFVKGLPQGSRSGRVDWLWCGHHFNALAAGPDFILTANANGDFFRLDKGSVEWKPVPRKRIDRNGWWAPLEESKWPYFGKALGSITVDPRNPAHWYFTDWYAVWQTDDSGSTWRPTTEGMAQTVGFMVASDFFDHELVYLGMADNGYFRSSDKGSTWRFDKIDSDVTCFAPSPSERGVVYACGGRQASIQASFDSGATWKRVEGKGLPKMLRDETGVYGVAVDACDAKKLYSCVGSLKAGEGGVYASHDSGETWTRMSRGLPEELKTPKGENISLFQRTLWNDAVGSHPIASSKDGSLVCISYSAKAAYRWDAETGSWRDAEIKERPCDILADPFVKGRFVIAAGNGVLVSEDGGRTWRTSLDVKALKPFFNPTGKWFSACRVAIDPQIRGRMAVVAQDNIFISSDGGKTWGVLADRNIPDKSERRSPAFQGGRLLVETLSAGVFWIDMSTAKIDSLPSLENSGGRP